MSPVYTSTLYFFTEKEGWGRRGGGGLRRGVKVRRGEGVERSVEERGVVVIVLVEGWVLDEEV